MTPPDPLPLAKKRRGSSLTLVIMAVNIIPLLIMGFGIFYLDKYKQNLIKTAFINMSEKTRLISVLLEENPNSLSKLALNWPDRNSLFLLNEDGEVISSIGSFWNADKKSDQSMQVMNFTDTFAALFVYLNPLQTSLPPFPADLTELQFSTLPEVDGALFGKEELSAWTFENSFIMTATRPVHSTSSPVKAIIIITAGDHITEAIDEVRRDIMKAFITVIILTFLLSVYLSSFIAIPLKKLGRAAEDIRSGKRGLTDLPDMSHRKDEIGELSIILRQMTVALDSRLDSFQSFAADVAHEIKNPITSIRSAIETALKVNKKEDRDGLLKIMEQDVHRLDRLITDISRHSRLDTDLARDSYQVIDLKQLINDLITLCHNPIDRQKEEHNRENSPIETIFPDQQSAFVLGKGDSLGQVFQNLISNALSFHMENTPIKIIMKIDAACVKVLIEDKGPGIPAGQLNKIFERFYTDRPMSHDVKQNSGLGLAIAKQIIEAHDGKIYAENIESGDTVIGARFVVKLKRYHA